MKSTTSIRSWAIDHQPKTLKQCSNLHLYASNILNAFANNSNDMNHLFVYGPPGSGKRTLISCFIADLYSNLKKQQKEKQENNDEEELKKEEIAEYEEDVQEYKIKTEPTKLRDTEIHVLQSELHIELSMSALNSQPNQTLLFEYLQEIGESRFLNLGSQIEKLPFFIVWLKDCDNFTYVTEKAFGILMESFGHKLKFILSSKSYSDLKYALISRCNPIHISAPTYEQIILILKDQITKKEDLQPETLKPDWFVKCSRYSKRNLRIAIECFQTTYFSKTGALAISSWKTDLYVICDKMIEECSNGNVDNLFLKYEEYLLSGYGITGELLLNETLERFFRNATISDAKKYKIVNEAALTEKRMHTGLNPFVHLKYFICKACQIICTEN